MDVKKIKLIQDKLNNNEAVLVTQQSNIFYITNVFIDNIFLFIQKDKFFVLTSPMLESQVRVLLNINNLIVGDNLCEQLKKLNVFKIKKVLFDVVNVPLSLYTQVKKFYKNVSTTEIVYQLRMVKTEQEIEKIVNGIKVVHHILKQVKKILRQKDVTEIQVKNFILKKFIEHNVQPAFEPIVAFGENTAFPHHIPTSKKLKINDIVLIDLGCKYQGYCCDITRMYMFDRSKKINELYKKLKMLQQQLIQMCTVGRKVKDIDEYARKYFEKIGMKDNYLHSTGHGIGIDIHEKPQIYYKDSTILKKGMVITIEPGIYFEKKFGLRIEDNILVTDNKPIVLSKFIV